MREEGEGDWSELHNEELHNLYATPDSIKVIKSRSMSGVGLVAWMGDGNSYKIVGKPEGRDHVYDLGVDGNVILDWIIGK
jgi:hypothetical protein